MQPNVPVLTFDFFRAASPILILAIGGTLAFLQSVFKPVSGMRAVKVVQFVTLILAFISALSRFGADAEVFLSGAFVAEPFATLSSALILGIGLVTSLMFHASHHNAAFFRGEVSSIFQYVLLGALTLVSADEMVSMFVGLEIASIGTYALVGYITPSRKSMEGAVKYLTLGAFATAFLLFGMALFYAASGSLRISEIVQALSKLEGNSWAQVGVLFFLAGAGFKFALVPFHLWAPDVYESAPTPLTAFMATAIKVMVMSLVLRFVSEGFKGVDQVFGGIMVFLAACSMILGNIMALVQASLKRMLAYSSIAHSGYMAIALAALSVQAGEVPVAAVFYYLIGYTVLSLGAFAVLQWFESVDVENIHLDDLAGISKKYPWAAFALTVFMFSFAGFPPTVGFIAKFFVFAAALQGGLYTLVVLGVIGSMISVFYYLRVIMKMYFAEPIPLAISLKPQRSMVTATIIAIAVILTFVLGIVTPGPGFESLKHYGPQIGASAH